MKRLWLFSAITFVLFLLGSCGKSENGKKQVKLVYQTSIDPIEWYLYDEQVTNPEWASLTKIPKELYGKIKSKINDYCSALAPESFLITCNADNFQETIKLNDSKIVASQKRIASNFEVFFKTELESLLNDKETYGDGELSLKIVIGACRYEEDFKTNSDKKLYETWGNLNNEPTEKTFEPIVFEIKYKNPD